MIATNAIQITPKTLTLIAGVLNALKGTWRALSTLAPDRLSALRRAATIESISSSTRIAGSNLSDREFDQEHARITMGETIRLTNGNRNTLKQHFRAPPEQNHLSQRGAGRGVWYELR